MSELTAWLSARHPAFLAGASDLTAWVKARHPGWLVVVGPAAVGFVTATAFFAGILLHPPDFVSFVLYFAIYGNMLFAAAAAGVGGWFIGSRLVAQPLIAMAAGLVGVPLYWVAFLACTAFYGSALRLVAGSVT